MKYHISSHTPHTTGRMTDFRVCVMSLKSTWKISYPNPVGKVQEILIIGTPEIRDRSRHLIVQEWKVVSLSHFILKKIFRWKMEVTNLEFSEFIRESLGFFFFFWKCWKLWAPLFQPLIYLIRLCFFDKMAIRNLTEQAHFNANLVASQPMFQIERPCCLPRRSSWHRQPTRSTSSACSVSGTWWKGNSQSRNRSWEEEGCYCKECGIYNRYTV